LSEPTRAAPAALVDHVIERTVALAAIPAPSLDEGERAALVSAWWSSDGLDRVHRDQVGNVWGCVIGGSGPAVVVCAHLDTVFGPQVDHTVRRDGDLLVGPGVGDDAVAVAALSTLADMPGACTMPVWVLATVGEEGLGNLRGIRAALAEPPTDIAALIAVEGNYLGRVCTVGVGSCRWAVTLSGPGGHAWERADDPSAVHVAARLIAQLDQLDRPSGSRTSVNVGRMGGGEAINARAREAHFELDVRADDAAALDELAERVVTLIRGAGDGQLSVSLREVGRRPAGAIEQGHPLTRAASDALCAIGRPPTMVSGSTDANAAYAAGVPAVAVGVTVGAGEHTLEEWIDLRPLPMGMWALTETVRRYAETVAS